MHECKLNGDTIELMLLAFFSWWYGAGWKQVTDSLQSRLNSVLNNFSVRQLLRTLFSPWRRIITPSGRSLDAKLRAAGDNAFSRVIGFIVRLLVLFAAGIALLLVALLSLLELAVWPLLPLAIPGCVIAGLAL